MLLLFTLSSLPTIPLVAPSDNAYKDIFTYLYSRYLLHRLRYGVRIQDTPLLSIPEFVEL